MSSAPPIDVFYPIVPDADWLTRLVPLGVRTIQLRLKEAPRDEILAQIARSQTICAAHHCKGDKVAASNPLYVSP